MLSTAIKIASEAFEGRYDQGGSPYILHCLYVMNKVKHHGDDYAIVGVLHDLVEDVSPIWSFKKLKEAGFSDSVIEALKLLTHLDEPYEDYIDKISKNHMASMCKLADLEHNMKASRLKGIRQKDFDRMIKYIKAYSVLKEAYVH